MNDNQNNTNRPRVVWKNGKCIICPPSQTPAQNRQTNAVPTQKRTTAPANASYSKPKSAPKASQKIHTASDNDSVSIVDFFKGLKYKSSIIAAVLIIAVLSVIVAALVTTFSAREADNPAPIPDDTNIAENNASVEYVPPENIQTALSGEGFAVCIDPGHGYDDVGTSNDELGVYEHEVVLKVGLKLRDKLEEAGIKVYMTHDTNERPPEAAEPYLFGMKKRNGLANSLSDVDLFISIHCDAYFEDPTVSGARVYHMSDDKGGEGVADAISESLAELDPDEEIHVKAMSGMNSYQVLRESEMPAVLVETGFLSNPEEGAAMLTDKWVESMADALANAIIKSFENGVIGA